MTVANSVSPWIPISFHTVSSRASTRNIRPGVSLTVVSGAAAGAAAVTSPLSSTVSTTPTGPQSNLAVFPAQGLSRPSAQVLRRSRWLSDEEANGSSMAQKAGQFVNKKLPGLKPGSFA